MEVGGGSNVIPYLIQMKTRGKAVECTPHRNACFKSITRKSQRHGKKHALPFHESVCLTATTCDLLPSPKRLLTAIKRTVLCFAPKDSEGGKWRPRSLITSAAVRISCVSDRILMSDDRSYSLMAGSYRSSHQQQWLWLLLLLPAISGSIIAALMNMLAHEGKTQEKKADPWLR